MNPPDSARTGGGSNAGGQYRVMVVDDSAVVRGLVTRFLESDPDVTVVASVGNGQRALDTLARSKVEVVVLDIEMPVMDGLTALPKLLKAQPGLQVIMSSTLTKSNADISLRALQAGAAEYVTKPSSTGLSSAEAFQEELRNKVKALGRAFRKSKGAPLPDGKPAAERARPAAPARKTSSPATPAAPAALKTRAMPTQPPEVIAIGSSTGGPQALFKLLTALGPVPQPILITQHMPGTFTALLADHIARQTRRPCREAREGEVLERGSVFVAPGGRHLVVKRERDGVRLSLSDGPAENFCKPSVDPMLRSLTEVYGSRLLVTILTGMGSDGLQGCKGVVAGGGHVIAQDEASSVVWGMPGAVAKAGLCSAVLPLEEIAPALRRIVVRSAA